MNKTPVSLTLAGETFPLGVKAGKRTIAGKTPQQFTAEMAQAGRWDVLADLAGYGTVDGVLEDR